MKPSFASYLHFCFDCKLVPDVMKRDAEFVITSGLYLPKLWAWPSHHETKVFVREYFVSVYQHQCVQSSVVASFCLLMFLPIRHILPNRNVLGIHFPHMDPLKDKSKVFNLQTYLQKTFIPGTLNLFLDLGGTEIAKIR